MSKITFSSLGLKTNTNINKISFKGHDIEVLKYLPQKDKEDIIAIVMQNSLEDGVYNPIKLDMYLKLFIVYVYTNITFTDKQRENEYELFDAMNSGGLIEAILNSIDENELKSLRGQLYNMVSERKVFDQSFAGILNTFINELPKKAESLKGILDSIDKDKFQSVIDIAKAAGYQPDV